MKEIPLIKNSPVKKRRLKYRPISPIADQKSESESESVDQIIKPDLSSQFKRLKKEEPLTIVPLRKSETVYYDHKVVQRWELD